MIRVDLDLENPDDLRQANAQWRFAQGLVPGEPNEGLVAQIEGSPARLADYDDSRWEICESIQEGQSKGVTFGWYRITITVPEQVHGMAVKGLPMHFETCIDDYGEIWINDECNRQTGAVAGFNIPQRVLITRDTQPGTKYVIACLAVNGPLAAPGGGIFMRYARLAFENYATSRTP